MHERTIALRWLSKMEKDYIHKTYPKKFQRDEFWSQIKRTVNGVPVTDSQINMIVNQILKHLKLNKNDCLLDLGCANAALASNFFNKIAVYKGVDFSSYLIDIANEFFKKDESIDFLEADVREYVKTENEPEKFNKVLCYGVMAYLSKHDFVEMVEQLKVRFTNLERIFIGNIPDLSMAEEFFLKREIRDYSLDDPQSPIGVWWDKTGIYEAMQKLGFEPVISKMPEDFYSSNYRFDLTLVKK